MPTVIIERGYRLFFYAGDRNERIHVHVERDDATCKFWLRPIEFFSNSGFSKVELRRIRRIVEQHEALIEQEWANAFGNSN